MSWAGKFFGASIGAIFGPSGILAGSFAKHLLDGKKKKDPIPDAFPMSAKQRNHTLFIGSFTLISRIAKSNYSVSDKEAELLQYVMRQELSMNSEARSKAVKIFNTTELADSATLLADLSQAFRHDPKQLQEIFSMMLAMALADGSIAHKADQLLIETMQSFKIDASHYQSIRDQHLTSFPTEYDTLECAPGITGHPLKKIWRQHCLELHPDRLINLSDLQKNTAGIKLDKIHQAYQILKKRP